MSERILLIEDEAAIREVLLTLLVTAGYEVIEAADGLEGIAAFRAQEVDLVLLDIMLPKIDGYTVCEALRCESDVPIIMLTALDAEDAQLKAFQLEVDDYITKPFSLSLVLARVAAVLRRRGAPKTTELLEYGPLCLDLAAHVLYKNDEPIALTQLEYGLLALFMAHPGQVFTRETLLEQVWGYDFCGDEKAVNIHIMNLRRKLGANVVETIRGVGYRFGKVQ